MSDMQICIIAKGEYIKDVDGYQFLIGNVRLKYVIDRNALEVKEGINSS